MNDNKTIQFSKVCNPNKWDELPDPIFACKTDEDALKAQIFMNGLYSKIDKLERKLKIAEFALGNLYAVVKGECPSLLNEDSGGDAELDCQIIEALKQIRGE